MVAKSVGPDYDFGELVAACSVPGKVYVRKDAIEDAKKFGLGTKNNILAFVANGIFEDLKHQNTDVLDFPPDKGTTFDAYYFRIGPKYVYFAFYKNPTKDLWIIKSFHPPEHGENCPSLSHTPFAMLENLKI